MNKLPVELLYQVCTHVEPQDLLALRATCRGTRDVIGAWPRSLMTDMAQAPVLYEAWHAALGNWAHATKALQLRVQIYRALQSDISVWVTATRDAARYRVFRKCKLDYLDARGISHSSRSAKYFLNAWTSPHYAHGRAEDFDWRLIKAEDIVANEPHMVSNAIELLTDEYIRVVRYENPDPVPALDLTEEGLHQYLPAGIDLEEMRIASQICGNALDFVLSTIPVYPHLELEFARLVYHTLGYANHLYLPWYYAVYIYRMFEAMKARGDFVGFTVNHYSLF